MYHQVLVLSALQLAWLVKAWFTLALLAAAGCLCNADTSSACLSLFHVGQLLTSPLLTASWWCFSLLLPTTIGYFYHFLHNFVCVFGMPMKRLVLLNVCPCATLGQSVTWPSSVNASSILMCLLVAGGTTQLILKFLKTAKVATWVGHVN